MKKLFASIFILLFIIETNTAETVKIDFFPEEPEEFDIFFKKGFESIGYTVFVNYFNRSESRPYDLLFKYECKGNMVKVFLYDKNGKLLKQSEKNLIYFDRVETETYLFLEKFMGRRINVKDRRGKVKGGDRISFFKLDSAVYLILTKGTDKESEALELFLNAGTILAGKFRTYYEISKYQCTYSSGLAYTPYCGKKIMGIVIGDDSPVQGFTVLDTPPEIYSNYLAELTKNIPLPSDNLADTTLPKVYFLRRTGIVAGALPFMIYIDGKLVCYLYNNKYAVSKLDKGKHNIVVKLKEKSKDTSAIPYVIDVNSSKNIFVNIMMESSTEFSLELNIDFVFQDEKEYLARLFLQNLTSDDCEIGR